MAIDFSKPATKTGLDFSKEVARIPKKIEPPKPAAPVQVTMPTPIDNAKSLFSGGGFQAFGKTVYPTPAPQPSELPKSQYNPFSSFDNQILPKINTNIGGSTPAVDLNAQSPVSTIFGAVRGVTDYLTLPITMAVNKASIKEPSFKTPKVLPGSTPSLMESNTVDTKYLVDSTLELARKDMETGGTYGVNKASQDYLKSRNITKGGNTPTVQDIAVLGSIGFFNMFGDAALGVPGSKAVKEFLIWKNVGKIEKPLKEGVTITKGLTKDFQIADNLKIKIIPKENSVVFKGYIKRGSKAEVLNAPFEIEGVAEEMAKSTGREIIPTVKGSDLVLKASPDVAPKGLNFSNELAQLSNLPKAVPSEGLSFAGQEQLNQKPQVIEPVSALDFKAEPTAPVAPAKISEPAKYSVFRGTNAEQEFLQEAGDGDMDFGPGYYFADNHATAKEYGPKVTAYDVTLNNPLKVKDRYEMNGIWDEFIATKPADDVNLRDWLKSQGYDGIVVEDGGMGGEKGVGGFKVAFNENQIKAKDNKITLTTDFDVENMDDPRTIKAQYEAELLSGIENSQAGRRIILGSGIEKQVITESSTFPAWIPDKYRKSAIIQPVIEHIKKGTLPTSKPQLEFYNIIKEDFDSFGNEIESAQKEINADEIDFGTAEKMLAEDEKLLKQYDQQEKSITSKSESVSAKETNQKVGTEKVVPLDKVRHNLIPIVAERVNKQTPKILKIMESLKAGEDVPAIPVYEENGMYVINNDGFHRLTAHQNLGLKNIKVRVEEKTTLSSSAKQKLEHEGSGASGKVKADKGVYSEEVKGKGETDLKTIETPEQYRLAKAIGPNMSFVMKNSRKYNGYFSPQPGAEEIGMNRALYKRGKDETKEAYQLRIGKTMAHEIGHFIDYLPDEVTNRGNLIGRLQTLSNFKRNFIAEDDVLKQRQTLMRKINEINKNDELLDSMQAKLTEPLMKELQALNDGITFNNPAFKDELVKLTHKWKPWVEGVDEKYDAYRKNAAELYADFNSVLFNDPALAQEIAPRFYNEFFNFLSKKPEVEKAFLGIQSELMGDRASLMEKRYQMLKDSGKNAQQKFVSMIAERDALKKKPWMEAAKKEMWYQHAAIAEKGVKPKNQIEILDRGFHNETSIIGETKIKPILENLKTANLDSNDMDAILVLDRIAKDLTRQDVANIKGMDIKTSQDVLDELINILGEEKAKTLVKAAEDLRAVLQEEQLKQPDLFTPEMRDLIASNDFFAPFNVLFKESNNINYYIKQSTGNIDKDFSAFTNTILRLRSVIHAGYKNTVQKNLIDMFLAEEGSQDIKPAEVSYQKMENGQLVRTVKKAPQGWGQVDIKRNGKVESYYMPEDIAHSLNQDRIQDTGTVFKFLKAVNKPFRQLYTGPIAIGFQIANFVFRDAGTASLFFGPEWTRSQKGLSNAGLNILANNTYRLLFSKITQAKYYYKAFKDLREKNIAKRYTPMVLEAMKNHVVEVDSSATFTMDTKDLSQQEEAGMKYVLNLMGLTEKGTKWQEFGAKTRGFTQSLEETPKLAAYMYFNDLGIVNEQNLVNIRNHVGSPNFWSKGTLNGQLSGPLMFYNPIIQGQVNMFQKAIIKDGAGKGSRNAFWWRMFRKAILPVMVTVAAEEGMFGEDIKKMMDRVPEYMLTSYDVIPMYIIPGTGKLRYISLPRDEEARFVGALTRKILKTAVNSEDKAVRKNAISDLLTFTGGQLPSSAPGLSIVNTWSMAMLANANPYDSFRGQNIFLTNEENLPKSEKAKILAKWTLNQSGFLKLNIHDSVESRTIDEQTIAMTPGVNRFVRTDNRGIYEDDQKIVDAEREKAALELMKKKGVVNGVVEAVHKDPKYNANAELLKLAKERLGAEASDSKALLKEFKTLNSAMQEEYVTNFGNVHYRSLINQSNDTKEKLLLSIYDRGEMTKKEYVNFLVTSKSLNLISNEIIGKVLVGTGLANLKK